MKKKLIQSLRAILLFIFMIISLFTVNIYANDKLELPTDKNGNYLIQSEKDFNTFVNYVNSNEKFENKKVILCSDLDITATTC